MTVILLVADPPRDGLVLPRIPAETPLTESEATGLYRAMLADTMRAAVRSGSEGLVVNYPPEDLLAEVHRTGDDPADELRAVAEEALDEQHVESRRFEQELGATEDVRFEPQVGSTFAARVGNAATHILDEEGAATVAAVEGDAPMLLRTDIDSAAMKLRQRDVVVGPSERGRAYFLGLGEPLDFTDAYEPPALETLVDRAVAADREVAFMPQQTKVETGGDLASLVSVLAARRAAGRIVPVFTTAYVEQLGLRVDADGDDVRLVR